MQDNLTKSMAGLNDSVKQYLQARLDLFKLLLLKKASKSMSFFFGSLIIILMSTVIVIFSGAAFTFWYGKTFNNYLEGVLIVIGFLLIVSVLFIVFRKRILTSVFLSGMSEILYEENEIKDN